MKIKLAKSVGIFVIAVSVFLGLTASADGSNIEYDQDVTPDVIFGDGNTNGGFTTDRRNGIELGLRAKIRFPLAIDIPINSNGDGSYFFPSGSRAGRPSTALWSFDWSVNTDYEDPTSMGSKVGDFIYELGMDADPGSKTKYTKFDPITPSLIAPANDHSMGDNSTANDSGIEATSVANYLSLLTNNNVAQQSWQYEFFNNLGTSLAFFDPAVDGNYVIYLKAKDPVSGKTVAETWIQVLVGDTAVKIKSKKKSKKSKKSKK